MSLNFEDGMRALTSTPSSTTSGCLSGDDYSEDQLLPSSLAAEELQLALNKVGLVFKKCIYCSNILGSHRRRTQKSYTSM